jgi:hypothetical protein
MPRTHLHEMRVRASSSTFVEVISKLAEANQEARRILGLAFNMAASMAKTKKLSAAKRKVCSVRPTKCKAPEILKKSEAERRKIIKKLMPLLRSGTALTSSTTSAPRRQDRQEDRHSEPVQQALRQEGPQTPGSPRADPRQAAGM